MGVFDCSYGFDAAARCGRALSVVLANAAWRTAGVRILIVAATVFCAAAGQLWAAEFSFQGLGVLPGYIYSQAYGVSDNGRVVVGRSFNSGATDTQAFMWTAASGIQPLPGVPAAPSRSVAWAVSGDGSVIVGSIAAPGSNDRAFRWTSTDGMTLIQDQTLTPKSARAITPDGQTIVGSAGAPGSVGGSSANVSYYQTAGGVTSIGDLPGDIVFSAAHGVSADGSAIAGFGTSADATQAYRWTAADGMVPLGDLPGGPTRSLGLAISADGSTVVGQADVSPSGGQPFRWTSDGGIVGLGYLPGGYGYGEALGVSGDGSIVVGASNIGGQPLSEAFLWTEASGMLRLSDYLTAHGVDQLADWSLWKATAITPDGRTIVGVGFNPQGQFEGWVATIPEPPTYVLALVALITLGINVASRRR